MARTLCSCGGGPCGDGRANGELRHVPLVILIFIAGSMFAIGFACLYAMAQLPLVLFFSWDRRGFFLCVV